MSARVLLLDGDGHHAVQALLPWYVSGRLDRAEITDVEAHLAGCTQCRDELAWERKMFSAQATLGSSSVEVAERGLAQLQARIQAADHAKHSPLPGRPMPRTGRWWWLAPWLPWALGAQFAAILLLTVLLVVPQKPPELAYRALGAPAQVGPANVVVRFRPDAAELDIRRALQDAGARLVDGPTVTDAYLLSVPAERQAAALAGLRATPIVVLAESLDAGARP
jgi:anti-sigma factor RsiW